MNIFTTHNPYTGKTLEHYTALDKKAVDESILAVEASFRKWSTRSITERSKPMFVLAGLLRKKKLLLAELITLEMGKPMEESKAEIEKCAWLCDYYAAHAGDMLAQESIKTDAKESYLEFEPMGIIYAIMPWNFPFWQVLRAAVPTIMAGNAMVLKHAPNVIACAEAIEKLFIEAGFPQQLMLNLVIDHNTSDYLISKKEIRGVTLTGSLKAGQAVAMQAAKHIKKVVLELGGSDPFIVLKDADLDRACSVGVQSRMLNAGQVCIAAKRFIVVEAIYDDFVEQHKKYLENISLGDPMDPATQMGPLARPDLRASIEKQVDESIQMGARLICGGKEQAKPPFFSPTLLTDVSKGMPVYDEETFGPVSVVIKARDEQEAIQIANDSPFGLGCSIWTDDLPMARQLASQVESGAVFINGMTKSDPRLPFGGIKESGYGRELGSYGIKEFLNIKTIWIA